MPAKKTQPAKAPRKATKAPRKPRAKPAAAPEPTWTEYRGQGFSIEVAERVLSELASGRTLTSVCRDPDMPSAQTVCKWALNDINGFAERYETARKIGYMLMADEIVDIAEDGSNDWMERHGKNSPGWIVNGEAVQRSKLRTDTRKWLLPKVLPDMYGDKSELVITDKRSDSELLAELAELEQKVKGLTATVH